MLHILGDVRYGKQITRWTYAMSVDSILVLGALPSPPAMFDEEAKDLENMTSKEDMDLVQMDVETVLPDNDLDYDIYMQQPKGFAMKGKEILVWKLKMSLYGLK